MCNDCKQSSILIPALGAWPAQRPPGLSSTVVPPVPLCVSQPGIDVEVQVNFDFPGSGIGLMSAAAKNLYCLACYVCVIGTLVLTDLPGGQVSVFQV